MATFVAQDNLPDTRKASTDLPARRGWVHRLLGYCRRYPGLSVVAAIGSCGLALNSLTPLLTKSVIDSISGTDKSSGFGWAIAGLAAVAILLFATTFLRRWSAGKLSLNVQHDLRQDVFTAIQRLDGPGQDRLHTGQVVSRASSDLQMVQGLMSMVPMVFGQLVMFGVSFVLMLILSPVLTLTGLVVIPAAVQLTRTTRSTIFPATWMAQQSAADVAEIVEEDVTGVRVVKGFGQEDREIGRLRAAARTLYGHRLRAVRLTAKLNPALAALTSVGQVAVLLLGGWLTINGSISLGTFVAFTLYLAALVGPTRMITMLYVLSQQAGAAVERVLEIVDLDAEIVDPPDPAPLPAGPLSVELTDVRFGYRATSDDATAAGPGTQTSADDAVLNRFDLLVPAGRTVAVVGPSGSGKSTLSMLLPRFYDVQAGSVRVGGVDVRDATMSELRESVGVVFEEAFLFSTSLSENIAYGRPGATEAEIRAAADAAEATEFILRLPQGFDTVVGERGLTLSGGQRQRLALARAMLTDPRVLILDDATSAVDPATESAIHATLHKLTADRTTILIAHRRSTLALADTIAVVSAGRVLDHGTHEELIGRCALYRSLLGTDLAAAPTESDLVRGPDGLTPQLWPVPADPGPDQVLGQRSTTRSPATASSGRGGGAFSAMADIPATPELLAKITALPPVNDTPVAENQAEPAAGQSFSLWHSLRSVRGLLAAALIFVGLDALATAGLPALLRAGVDDGVANSSMATVAWLTLVAAALVLGDYLVQRAQMVTMGRAGESVLFHLRSREFTHLQRLGLDYYEREMAGRIMTRMTNDVDALSSFLQTGMVTASVSLATFVAIAVALLVMNVSLALVAFATLPILALATYVFRRYSSRQYTKAREQVAVVNADLQENVAGLRISQALGRQDSNSSSFAEKSDDYRRIRMRAQTAIATYFPFVALLADLTAAAVLAVGAHRVQAGALTAGTLLAFVLYLNAFFTPIQQLSQVFDGYQQARVALTRISELLDTPTSTPAAAQPKSVQGLSGSADLQHVGFGYNSTAPPALIDVDLQLVPGETVAVVGATGAGKSTMVKLLARYYDVTSGRIVVDGNDIRDLDLPSYRRRLGVVPQEAHLFVGTVRHNIAYGRPDASNAEVEAAARAVGALDTIAGLSNGFSHQITERGRNLSAGQRQLISLARAELVQPDILLLDEATAALDPAAEAAVLDATDALAAHRTTVVVAHRLTTASRADRIVVMSHGRIVEIGTHDELLARGSAYSALYAGSQG